MKRFAAGFVSGLILAGLASAIHSWWRVPPRPRSYHLPVWVLVPWQAGEYRNCVSKDMLETDGPVRMAPALDCDPIELNRHDLITPLARIEMDVRFLQPYAPPQHQAWKCQISRAAAEQLTCREIRAFDDGQ